MGADMRKEMHTIPDMQKKQMDLFFNIQTKNIRQELYSLSAQIF